ncbi:MULTISPECIES: mechanosensitive ion channel family protein [Paeniglutamicibacter]|uniref:Mechanosensitive ion channel n=1 Tax=Paeniglutamicibacter terrestris TaxID=2723403 RepID=A0ABX1G159_9MICC|nr:MULTISPECIES: mechanosensitive ion channel domain-containing protein [Paeniglutamicibacter]ASN38386.1 mechanosensitive ion channel protein MscS [Arthrobacter sp. 7749]NKG19376.1 mechanosensitive ion channel [Paeniglutamicibacter terrestris]QXQ09605.1 mechanosensitive ion channel family protein [Paeniglutamicibacter sp. Y32M11]
MQIFASSTLDDTVSDVVQNTDVLPEMLKPWVVIAIGLLAAVLLTVVLGFIINRMLHRVPGLAPERRMRRMPLALTLVFAFTKVTVAASFAAHPWVNIWQFVLLLGLICSIAWLLIVIMGIFEEIVLAKYREDEGNPRRLAKIQTQVGLLRRVATALVITLAVAGALLTIPEVRALGAGLLASAGLISVVAALAVQSTLANVFAGLQIAFTDAIRVNDTVVVETQRGAIEEITLTYVVVLLLDGRRLIIPSTYFTTTPFENWSRRSNEISGTVLLDLNWNAPIEHLRTRTEQLLASTDLWDGRTGDLNVTDAIGGILKVTIAVSARNPGDLYDLRNFIREHLISELRRDHPEALPKPLAPGTAPAA